SGGTLLPLPVTGRRRMMHAALRRPRKPLDPTSVQPVRRHLEPIEFEPLEPEPPEPVVRPRQRIDPMEGVYDDDPPPKPTVRRRERIDPMAGVEDDPPPPKPKARRHRQRIDPMADDHGPDLRLVKTDDEPKPERFSEPDDEPPWWFDEMVKPFPGFGRLSPERQEEFGRVAAFLQSIVGADGKLPERHLVELDDAGFEPGTFQDI